MCRLLDFLAVELGANRNFEFVQALLQLVLQARTHLYTLCRACQHHCNYLDK